MKYRIKSLDEVAENLRHLYVADVNEFVLKLDEGPAERMRRRRNNEKNARKEAERKLRELEAKEAKKAEEEEAKKAEEDNDNNKKKGDVDAIEKSWQKKYEQREQELLGQVSSLKSHVQTTAIDGFATSIASDLFTSPNLAMPHIKSRLGVEEVDGKFVTRILDAEGKPTALTADEFKKELSESPDFKAILKVSKANGGAGAPNFQQQNNQNQGGQEINLAKASPADLVAAIKAKESI